MHVFPMASVESTAGLAVQESWRRGSWWHCAGLSHAWSKCHWQDEYAISLICIIFSIFSYFDLAKTIEIDALQFQNKDLNVIHWCHSQGFSRIHTSVTRSQLRVRGPWFVLITTTSHVACMQTWARDRVVHHHPCLCFCSYLRPATLYCVVSFVFKRLKLASLF